MYIIGTFVYGWCPAGWSETHKGQCMKIYGTNLPQTWEDARSRCQLQEGELASLRDSEQKVRDKEWREKGQVKTK